MHEKRTEIGEKLLKKIFKTHATKKAYKQQFMAEEELNF